MRDLRQREPKDEDIAVDRFVCANTKLIINTAKPGKAPLEFDISDLRMKDIGPGLPLRFDATLVESQAGGRHPVDGAVRTLNEKSPRDTAVVGDYSFTDADLGTHSGHRRNSVIDGKIWRDAGTHRSGRADRYARLSDCGQRPSRSAAHRVSRNC